MVFQIITIDNWSIVMFNCGRAVGPVGIVLPVIVFLLGTFFITNLFSAIIVNNFLEGDDETKPSKENPVAIEKSENTNVEVRIPIKDATVRNGDESHDTHNLESEDLSEGKSRLNLLSSSSKVAHDISSHILNHELFEVSITVIVCVSCVSLALDKPLNDPNSLLVERIYYVDLIVTIIFTVEMLFKVLVFGAFQKRGISDAYFRNAWSYFFSLYLSRIFLSHRFFVYCTTRMGQLGLQSGSGILTVYLLRGMKKHWHIISDPSVLKTFETYTKNSRNSSNCPISYSGIAVGR